MALISQSLLQLITARLVALSYFRAQRVFTKIQPQKTVHEKKPKKGNKKIVHILGRIEQNAHEKLQANLLLELRMRVRQIGRALQNFPPMWKSAVISATNGHDLPCFDPESMVFFRVYASPTLPKRIFFRCLKSDAVSMICICF